VITKRQRILITGGAGFIGYHLVAVLAQDHDVLVLDDLSRGRREHVPPVAWLVSDSVCNASRLTSLLRDFAPEVVYHLAARHYIPDCEADPVGTRHINVEGTRTLLYCLAGLPHKPQRLVFASTGAVYTPADAPHSEADPVGPLDVYGQTKLAGEELVTAFSSDTGIPAAIGRFFNIYGEKETNPHLIPEILSQLANGRIRIGNLTPARDYVHVSDAVEALLALGRTARAGSLIANVGTGVATTVKELLCLLERLLERPVELLETQERRRVQDRNYLVANPEHLESMTGFRPGRTLEWGLRRLACAAP
jgi:UDP-glucose 4-epimerase